MRFFFFIIWVFAEAAKLETSIKEVFQTSCSGNILTALLSENDHGSLLCEVKPVFLVGLHFFFNLFATLPGFLEIY